MRLKPSARQLYLHRVANMLIDIGRMPSSSRQRIIFDAHKATPCQWDDTKKVSSCKTGSTKVTTGQGPSYGVACVVEKDLRKSLGDRLINDWKAAETACKDHNDPSGGGTVVCNPAIFGVVAVDSGNPNRFTGVCVEPSIHATENCRALSLKPNERLDPNNKDENFWNPDMAKPKASDYAPNNSDSFGAFRADGTATQKLFQNPSFPDFFNQTGGGEIGDFCASGKQSSDNMTKFCVECQAMAKKMEFMNRDAQPGSGPGAPGGRVHQ